MPWRPLHPQHAIERTRVTVAFDQPILEKPANKAAADFESRSAALQFGHRESIRGFAFQISSLPLAEPPELAPFSGWTFSRLGPEGRPLEILTLHGAELTYDTFEYGRWALFRERLEKVLAGIPSFLSETFNHRMTSLQYLDRFIYDGPPTEADIRQGLLEVVASAIPEDAAAGRKLWHLHRGWWLTEAGRDVLVNQNMDCQDGQLADGRAARSLGIITTTELRFTNEQDGIESLYADLDLLHDVANHEFAQALMPEARKKVGLE